MDAWTMNAIYMLEWTYAPQDYFEESIRIVRDQYEMIIESGKVETKVNVEYYEGNPETRNQLHEALNDRFLGIQLLTHKPYELSKPTVCKIHPDGHKDFFLSIDSGIILHRADNVDLVVRDKDGNIVGDMRRERIERKVTIAELAEKYRVNNPVVNAILNSYHMAVIDPDNELVHLYEIRDALVKEFGGESGTKKILGISGDDWSKFGRIANDFPVKQGRHRGKHVGALRDATNDEQSKAREFSQKLILSFLEYLEH